MYDTTYVIMPVYNEETVVKEVIEGLAVYFPHIVCVDDGSSDSSVAQVEATGATLLRHTNNLGQGAALKTGIQYALRDKDAKYFITFDADGQHQVKDAIRMVETLMQSGEDIILGSRFLGEAENISWVKKMVLKLAIAFTNRTTGVHLTDTHNGLRAFNRRFAENVRLRCKGMAHASEIIYRIAEGKYRYSEVPVTITYSEYTKSKRSVAAHLLNVLSELKEARKELAADQAE